MRFQQFFLLAVTSLLLSGCLWMTADTVLQQSFDGFYREQVTRELRDLLLRTPARANEEQLKSELRNYRLGRDGYAFLARAGGRDLFHTERERLYKSLFVLADQAQMPGFLGANPAGSVGLLGQEQTRRYIAFAPVLETPWLVGIVLPVEESAPLLIRARLGLWTGCFAVALAALLVSALMAPWLARPWVQLADYARRRADGEAPDLPDLVLREQLDIADAIDRLCERPSAESEPSGDLQPLTGLPGPPTLQRTLFERIDAGTPFAAGLVDLSYFGSFTRRYGIERGDIVLRQLAVLLQNALGEHTYREHVLVHLEADRFAFIVAPEKIEPLCHTLLDRFEREIQDFYKPEDRKRGQITGKTRAGDFEQVPLMRLHIAVATNLKRPLIHPVQIGAIFEEILVYLKAQPKSGFLVDRREADRPGSQEPPEPSEPSETSGESVKEPPEPSGTSQTDAPEKSEEV